MATTGAETERIFEFEHDGFEFIEQAQDIEAYVDKMLGSALSRVMIEVSGGSRSW
ncbi:hypothetical protein ACO0LG_00345 [Undibacterium sp. Ji42W]